MLKNTFCHLPGVSHATENQWWAAGLACWEDLLAARASLRHRLIAERYAAEIEASLARLENNEPGYFASRMSSDLHWRLFPDFRPSIAYLDIETTGLGYRDAITTIVLYDGERIRHFINGQNLEAFPEALAEYPVIVTYNGKCFDVPFIERFFATRVEAVHLDLRYLLKSLGYSGGLKAVEQKMGLDRDELAGVDGYTAVLLWREYQRHRTPEALESLLAYNVQDVLNLEVLLVKAYNLKIGATPFANTHRLAMPETPPNPFRADTRLLSRIRYARY